MVQCRCKGEERRPMTHPHYPAGEIARRGKELYEKQLREQVETEENIGKLISIDIDTGDYEIDDSDSWPLERTWPDQRIALGSLASATTARPAKAGLSEMAKCGEIFVASRQLASVTR